MFVFLKYFPINVFILTGLMPILLGHSLALSENQNPNPGTPFTIADVHFEQNTTDGDAEVVFDVKGGQEGLSKLVVVTPDGRTVIDFTAPEPSTLGIRQFNFESPEPKNMDSLKSAYPEGTYSFTGITSKGKKLTGQSVLTHNLPSPAENIQLRSEKRSATSKEIIITWAEMKNISRVIIEIQQDELGVSIKAELPGTKSTFIVPPGFLAPATEYELGIGTVSAEGNIVFVETTFTTAKDN